ncbi:MAG: glycosyltransferase family A protein [Pseudomonadota bacterium]
MKSKVSIVIPTRHRPDTLAKTLLTVVNQSHTDIEVIVSNNGCNAETRAVVERLGDSRVRLVEPPQPLSMSHNFEFGMDHATGDWLVLIGDDDGILPTGIERGLRMLRESGAEALGSLACGYRWPVNGVPLPGAVLSIPMGSGWSWQSSERQMRRILRRDVGFNEAPMTYTGGMISADLFNRIKMRRGTFYHSQIPDAFSSFAFLSVIERYAFSHEPIAIAGVSSHSNGLATLSMNADQFREDTNIAFHPDLPLPAEGTLTFSFQAMLYESYLQTAYLRTGSEITNVTQQLAASIASARLYRGRSETDPRVYDATIRWVRQTAAHHRLDYDAIVKESRRVTITQTISFYRQLIRDFASRYTLDDLIGTKINDVYQASLAADVIRVTKPNRLSSVVRTFKRRLAR